MDATPQALPPAGPSKPAWLEEVSQTKPGCPRAVVSLGLRVRVSGSVCSLAVSARFCQAPSPRQTAWDAGYNGIRPVHCGSNSRRRDETEAPFLLDRPLEKVGEKARCEASCAPSRCSFF